MAWKSAFFIQVFSLFLILSSMPAYAGYACGNGVTDPGEQCDDGSWNSDTKPDACRTDCRNSHCGDGIADSREQCDGNDVKLNICTDHGYTSGFLGCTDTCVFDFSECRYCGDGIINDAEQCDDGNKIDDDGCNADCTPCLLLDQEGNIDLLDDVELCSHTYQMDDYGDFGVIVIKKTGITLDCDGAILNGEGRGIGIFNFRSHDVTIKNCEVHGYEVGIKIEDANNTTLRGNRLCNNSMSDIELVDATNNQGQNNRCNKAGGWGDDRRSGCSGKIIPCTVATVAVESQIPQTGYARSTAFQIQKQSPTPERQGTSGSYQSFKKDLKSVSGKASTSKSGQGLISSSQSPPSSLSKGKRTAAVTKLAPASTTYFFYNHAKKASWTSKAGKVVFGSDRIPQAGMAHMIASGRLANGKQARNLLVTQPDWKKGGFINGAFPPIRLRKGEHLYTTIGMLKGSPDAVGASFEILIKEGGRISTVAKKRVQGKNPVKLDVDLSRWAGKTVKVMLRVRPVKSGQQISAVWVNPRIASGG
jgi:cysteine-rich repeat protein/parallel beta-helix repeat protein